MNVDNRHPMTSSARKISIASGLALLFLLANLAIAMPDNDQYRDASYHVTTGTVVGMTILIDFPDDQAPSNFNAAAMNNMMTQIESARGQTLRPTPVRQKSGSLTPFAPLGRLYNLGTA